MRRLLSGIVFLPVLALMAASSCKDDRYDLDKVSSEVNLGGDIVLPLGNTVLLHLEDVAKLDSIKNFYCDLDGNYMFEFEDSVFFEFPRMKKEDLTVPGRKFSSRELSFDFPEAGPMEVSVPRIEVSDCGSIQFKIEKTSLEKEIVSIDSVVFCDGASISIDFKPKSLPSSDMKVKIEADFPPCLIFADDAKLKDGHYETESSLTASGISDLLKLKGIRYGGKIEDRVFRLESEIDFKVTLSVDGSASGISGPVNAAFSISLSDLVIGSVFGLIDPDLQPLSLDIDLSFIPEKFRSEENCFDLSPLIRFDARTNVDMPFIVDAELVPVIGGIEELLALQEVTLDVAPLCDMSYWIGSDIEGVPFGAEFHQIDSKALVEDAPDKINVSVDPKADTSSRHSYDMFKDYFFNMNYDASIPLTLGKDFRMCIDDTVRIKNIQDIAKMLKGTSFEIVGEIENTFPFDIDVEIIPLDDDMMPVDIETSISTIKGSIDSKVSVTELSAILSDAKKNLDKVSGFAFSFSGVSSGDGVKVNKNQYVKATLSAKVSGGVKLNLK